MNCRKNIIIAWEEVTLKTLNSVWSNLWPENASTHRAIALFDDTALSYYRDILKSRKKQTTMEAFLMKRPASLESGRSVCKKSKTNKQ